ncbi:unnamed protein product [Ectocarpus sp. 8 AP-2014]
MPPHSLLSSASSSWKAEVKVSFFSDACSCFLLVDLPSENPQKLIHKNQTNAFSLGKLAGDHENRLRQVFDRYGQMEVLGREIGTVFNVKTTYTCSHIRCCMHTCSR